MTRMGKGEMLYLGGVGVRMRIDRENDRLAAGTGGAPKFRAVSGERLLECLRLKTVLRWGVELKYQLGR